MVGLGVLEWLDRCRVCMIGVKPLKSVGGVGIGPNW